MVYTYIVEYYWAIKNNEIMSFSETWNELEITHTKWSKPDREK